MEEGAGFVKGSLERGGKDGLIVDAFAGGAVFEIAAEFKKRAQSEERAAAFEGMGDAAELFLLLASGESIDFKEARGSILEPAIDEHGGGAGVEFGGKTSDGFPDGDGTAAALVAVRTGLGEGTQRIVFEFAGDTPPAWQVGYEPLPVLADPTGEPVALAGSVALVVRITPSSTVNIGDGSFAPTYDGPRQLPVEGGSPAGELVLAGDFEGLLTWVVGLDARVPFAVDTLRSPSRLVIDLLAVAP